MRCSIRLLAAARALDNLERDNSRIIRVVQRRVQERANIQRQLSDLNSSSDIARLRKLRETEPIQSAWDAWVRNRALITEAESFLTDPDPGMRALFSEEHTTLLDSLDALIHRTFPSLLVPPSATKAHSALLELKAGVGGTESSLFLTELLRMYTRFASDSKQGLSDDAGVNRKPWTVDVISTAEATSGGIREALVEIKGEGAYDALKWESGVHRVQRVPTTDASGRVHTSTVAVIVLPLLERADHEQDNELFSMTDVRIDVMRARGAGGQHVNKTESAVRLTHIPTGITVSMQDERSQHRNKRRAFQILHARLMDRKLTADITQRRLTRNALVSSADRSEKIRTYNFPQERVTDHRINYTVKNLTAVLEGGAVFLDILKSLKRHHDTELIEDLLAKEIENGSVDNA